MTPELMLPMAAAHRADAPRAFEAGAVMLRFRKAAWTKRKPVARASSMARTRAGSKPRRSRAHGVDGTEITASTFRSKRESATAAASCPANTVRSSGR